MARKTLQLGRRRRLPASPGGSACSTACPIRRPDTIYLARFTAPEFTSLCPVTGQPDFAHLVIDYVPGDWLVEFEVAEALPRELPQSRRLPRGLHGHDRQALADVLEPHWLRIGGYWYPRGGIPIDVFWQTGSCRRACGCPTRASRPIAGGASGAGEGCIARVNLHTAHFLTADTSCVAKAHKRPTGGMQ